MIPTHTTYQLLSHYIMLLVVHLMGSQQYQLKIVIWTNKYRTIYVTNTAKPSPSARNITLSLEVSRSRKFSSAPLEARHRGGTIKPERRGILWPIIGGERRATRGLWSRRHRPSGDAERH